MKPLASILALIALAQNSFGSGIPVVDVVHIAHTAGNEILNISHYISTELNTLNTYTETVRQYENQIVQLARMGNPAALRSLPIVSSVAELYSTGQQAVQEYQEIKGLTEPRYWQSQLQGITSQYQLSNLQSLAYGSCYQFPSASYAVADKVQADLKLLEEQRQRLEQERDATLQALQGATDQSQVQKYSAALAAANGGLAEVGAREAALMNKANLQQQQLAAGRQVQVQQSIEQTTQTFSSSVRSDIGLENTLSTDFSKPPRWRQ